MNASFFGLFGAGLLTFLSPCVLPLMPILLASLMVNGSGDSLKRHQRLAVALWFVAGFSIVFILMGLSIPGLSHSLGGIKSWLLIASGILLALFGLKMMGALPRLKFLDWMNSSMDVGGRMGLTPGVMQKLQAILPRGLYGLLFGSLFGLSWTPCVGPILGGVLTYVASREATPWQGALLLLPFTLGIGLPILLLAWGSDRVLPMLNRLKPYLGKIEYGIGLALFAFGIYVANQGRVQSAHPVQAAGPNGAETAAILAVDRNGVSTILNSESNHLARLVFFYSEHCPICHAMESFLPELEADCSRENFQLIRVNTEQARNEFASQSFNVKAVPTISVLNDRGDEVVHLVGYQTRARLLDALRTTSKLTCKAASGIPIPSLNKEPVQNSTCGSKGLQDC